LFISEVRKHAFVYRQLEVLACSCFQYYCDDTLTFFPICSSSMHSIIFYRDMKQVLLVVQRSEFVALRSRLASTCSFFQKRLNSALMVLYSSSVWQLASQVRRP